MNERNEDRLFEIAIQETRGGKTPPDLTGRILAAAARDGLPGQAPPRGFLPSRQRTRLLGLAAGALIGLGIGIAFLPARARAPLPRLRVAVHDGALRHVGRYSESSVAAGEAR